MCKNNVLETYNVNIASMFNVNTVGLLLQYWGEYRNVRRDVTALIGWQRSHHWHPVMTRQKSC